MAGHYVARYDENTGDTIRQVIPPEVAYVTSGAYDTDNQGLLIGTTNAGLYQVSDDLQNWQAVESSVPDSFCWILAATERGCLMRQSFNIYEVSGSQAVEDRSWPSERLLNLKIYPNPANGTFRVDVPTHGKLEVFNVLGQRVLSREVEAGAISLRVPEDQAVSGTYLCTFIPNPSTARQYGSVTKLFLIR